MFNKVVMVGNLSLDIEIRYSQSGSAVANTAIATTRKFTQNGERKEEVCFIDITFFGRSAEVANQYLRRGSKILVEGRLKFDQWVAQDGSKRSKHSVIVDTMQMLDSKSDQGSNDQGSYSPQQPSHQYNAPQQSYQQPQDHKAYQDKAQPGYKKQEMPDELPGIDIDDDKIPFAYIGLQYPMSLHVI